MGIIIFVAVVLAVVIGVVIASKLTCKHDNEYEIEYLQGKTPTCLEEGLSGGKKCNYCGKIIQEQKILPTTNCINTEKLSSKAASCLETGLTEGKKCTICGKIVVKQEVIPKTNCNSQITLAKKDPTCTQTGLTQGKKCSVCGKTTVAQQTIDIIACKESSWIVDIEPTKTTDGSKHTECTMCEKTMRTQVLAAGSQGLTYIDQDDSTYIVKGGYYYSDPDVVIPRMYNEKDVVGIQYYGFMNNPNIVSLITPNTLTYIGSEAFYGCEKLHSVVLNEGLLRIELSAFKSCTSLETLTLPSTLNYIGSEAFYNCSSLTTIIFEGTVEQWNAISFGNLWNGKVPATEVVCSNGTVPLK